MTKESFKEEIKEQLTKLNLSTVRVKVCMFIIEKFAWPYVDELLNMLKNVMSQVKMYYTETNKKIDIIENRIELNQKDFEKLKEQTKELNSELNWFRNGTIEPTYFEKFKN